LEKKTAQDEAGIICHGDEIYVMSKLGSSKESEKHEEGGTKAEVSK
jgi:uncharacterized protein (UPF0128 family)